MNTLLECKNVVKTYKKGGIFSNNKRKTVLDNVNLTITKGRSFGLLGCNGSGKSTLTRMILGLEKPDSGNIIFNGEDVIRMVLRGDNSFRKSMQAVFQDAGSALNPRWSGFEAIGEPLINFEKLSKNQLNSRISELAETVGLNPEKLHKKTCYFSGGEQQRICIARALALNPSFLILDEAVSSLDMIIQERIIKLLKDLRLNMGLTYLVISHDLRVVFQLCEDVAVLSNGKIVENLSVEKGLETSHSEAFNRLQSSLLSV